MSTMTQRAQLGAGTFRMTSRNPEHLAALDQALAAGVASLDTALSYMNSEAQDAASRAYARLTPGTREQVLFVTKLGYIQGDLRQQILARTQEGRSLYLTHPINEYTDYSLAPAFLEEGISLTLERLPQGARPVVLIQSPEILQQRARDQAQFHALLLQACETLAQQKRAGRIAGFGISSQTLADPLGSESHLSLEALMEAVPTLGYIEFPLNLLESEAVHEPLFQERTLLEMAQHYGLTTLAQRPLLAQGDQPMRLISHPLQSVDENTVFERLKEALDRALTAERSVSHTGPHAPEAWAHRIRQNLESLMQHEKWRNIRAFEIEPALAPFAGIPEFADYLGAIYHLLGAMDAYAALSITQDTRHFTQLLDQLVPDLRAEATLQRKALAVYRALPGLHHILVGMRRTDQVRELTAPPRVELSQAQALRVFKEIALRTAPLAH